MEGLSTLYAQELRKRENCSLSSFVFPSYLFGFSCPLNSCIKCRKMTAVLLLFYSGLRVGEVLSLKKSNFIGDSSLYVSSSKNSKSRTVRLPDAFFSHLQSLFFVCNGFDNLRYNSIYIFVKKLPAIAGSIKQGTKRSITHYFRKRLIKNFYTVERWSFEQIIDYFGWRSNASLFYYL